NALHLAACTSGVKTPGFPQLFGTAEAVPSRWPLTGGLRMSRASRSTVMGRVAQNCRPSGANLTSLGCETNATSVDGSSTSQIDSHGAGQVPRTVRAVLVLIGFTAVIAQIVLMRELMVVFCGNEMSLGLMLASWLVWTAIG